jgi:tetratricopeptide (TPR) repeat protein
MINTRPLTSLLLCVVLTAFTPSCSFLYRITAPAGHGKKLTEDTAKLYAIHYDKYHYAEMRNLYAGTAEQIRNAADAAYQKKDFADAGAMYKTLFESGVTARDFSSSLAFDDEYLNRQMKACSKALLETGLTKYREGRLEDAISVWKKALVFDQDNKDIKSAIDTATTQLQNLKNLK